MLMGDEKETWKVKTLDEILLEKKRRRELEERTDPKRQKNVRVWCHFPVSARKQFNTMNIHSYISYVLVFV